MNIAFVLMLGFVSADFCNVSHTCDNNYINKYAQLKTVATCVEPFPAQNEFVNNPSDTVYIQGKNFSTGVYAWSIVGKNNSCQPGVIIANGTKFVGLDKQFCFAVYHTKTNECGSYIITFDRKKTEYSIIPINVIPEFGFYAGLFTLLASTTMFLMFKKYVERR